MFKKKEQFTRDQHNQRINHLENINYNIFSKRINLVPRPESLICNKRTLDREGYHTQRNIPLILDNRPTNSHCQFFKPTYHDSESKRELSYCSVFDLPLRDNRDITRPYGDLIWNQVTKRKFIEKDCRE